MDGVDVMDRREVAVRSWFPTLVLLSLGLALLAGLAPGCIRGTPEGGEPPNAVKRHVSTKAPEPQHKIGAVLGDRIELLGYDLEPAEPGPGDDLRITWHWHVKRALGDNWRLFTHLVDRSTGQMAPGGNFDNASVDNLRGVYPPALWQEGQYISDVQRITLPEKIPFARAELRIGIYQGDERLAVTKGRADNERRVRGPSFETGWEPPPIPEVTVPPAKGSLTIDGRLDEPAWRRAFRTPELVNATDGSKGGPSTKARLLYDDQHLYVAFECRDDHLHSSFTKRDDPLWTEDAVEVFIDPAGRGHDYYEFQVSPAGKIFDTLVHRHPRRDDSYDGHPRAAVQREGSLNNDSDTDRGWTVELAVPVAHLGNAKIGPGVVWRLNMFRLDDRKRGRSFLAWSPPLANTTHVPSRFAKITFGPATSSESPEEGAGPDAGSSQPDAGEPRPDVTPATPDAAGPDAASEGSR